MQTSLATPSPIAPPCTSLHGTWHVQGQGLPVVILPGAHVRWNSLDAVLSHWSKHYQLLLPSCVTKTAETEWLQSMATQLKAHRLQQPLHLIGLHEGAALACQLAAKLPDLSGLVLLNDQRHGCSWSSTAPGPDTLQIARNTLPPHISVLTVWLNAPGQTEPTDAALALTQNHTQHEWMVLPATSSAHTIAQFIHSWMQSHR